MPVLTVTPRLKVGLNLPQRKLRAGFSVTAMADMLFQLLIFFMLSANLTAFALLDIRSGALSGGSGGSDPLTETGRITDAASTAVWTISGDAVVASGQRFGLDRLDNLAAALADQGTANVLLVLRPDVPVHRVIAVLEALQARGITSVQIADGGGT
ncbi:ExbD/TolR family protein [Paracoccus sp. Ld10]|uniref:ExbD/TolR family protein n=1 Tax=Paracoccus sp. Ld10 TaxID=649158 RepID=UPI003868218C